MSKGLGLVWPGSVTKWSEGSHGPMAQERGNGDSELRGKTNYQI